MVGWFIDWLIGWLLRAGIVCEAWKQALYVYLSFIAMFSCYRVWASWSTLSTIIGILHCLRIVSYRIDSVRGKFLGCTELVAKFSMVCSNLRVRVRVRHTTIHVCKQFQCRFLKWTQEHNEKCAFKQYQLNFWYEETITITTIDFINFYNIKCVLCCVALRRLHVGWRAFSSKNCRDCFGRYGIYNVECMPEWMQELRGF